MKKLFLLPVIALVAIMAVSIVSASTCLPSSSAYCYAHPGSSCTVDGSVCQGPCACGSQWCQQGWPCLYTDVCSCDSGGGAHCSRNEYCVPEFGTIGMGIALIGASAGYALIRRKRK